MRDVLLAVPTRGQIQWATVTRLQEIRDRTGLPPIVYQPGNLSVALTRNLIVKRFLAGPWTALAMVDDDVIPPADTDFYALADHLDEYAMVAVPHPMPDPRDRGRLIVSCFDGPYENLRPVEPRSGVHTCSAVATGCVVISREALERLGPHPFRIAADPDMPIQSDDFLFCADLSMHGLRIGYVWEGGYCNHHTTVGLAELLDAGRRPQASVRDLKEMIHA